VKSLLLWILVGALVGIAAASVIVPPMLSWYNEAGYLSQGGQPTTVVKLPEVVRYATSKLIRGQAIGAAIGAVVFLALGLVLRRRRSSESSPSVSTNPSS
jgi:hypothetical protein